MKKNQGQTDEQLLDRDSSEGEWERAPADEQWWSMHSFPFPSPPIQATDLLIPISSIIVHWRSKAITYVIRLTNLAKAHL